MNHKKELVKLFKSFGYKYDLYTVFSDFVALSAIAISNSVDRKQFEQREATYTQLIKKYSEEDANVFPKMLATLTDALEVEMTDVLGQIYMELEISNGDAGQFFTPMSVSKLMAQLTIGDYESMIKETGFVTVNEPTVGGGVTIIALAAALMENGYNYQTQMKVVAQDIDIKSVHMSYLQFSLLGIDATVMRGDTLAYKFDSFWHTPMKAMNLAKEHQEKQAVEGMKKTIEFVTNIPDPKELEEPMQLSLF